MLKRTLCMLVLLICMFQSPVQAQETPDSLKAHKQDPVVKKKKDSVLDTVKFQTIMTRRERNFTFVQQTLNYAPLSYASPPYFEWGSSKKGYILSADISPNFVIGGKWMPVPIHLTARYKVRIFRDNETAGDNSLPVRTPSFMPGATIFLPLQKVLNEKTTELKYLSAAYFHHSDGQDGPEFNSDGSINLYNGNFSTNYVEAAYNYRIRKYVRSKENLSAPDYLDFYGRLGYEQHFITAKPLKSSYGGERINLNLAVIEVKGYVDKVLGQKVDEPYYRERQRVTLNSSFIASKRDMGLGKFQKRLNVDLNYHWRIPSSPNTALFGGIGYYGSDPYNIYYQQSYGFIRAGVALGFFVTPKMIGMR